jgi:hypothetical protein
MAVAIIITGLLVVVARIYKVNANYEMAHDVDEFIKAVDKGLFVANIDLQNHSFRLDNNNTPGNIGENGGLYLMVSDTTFESIYNALMKGDCMVRCFDSNDSNNSQCGGNTNDFNGMCQNNNQINTLCLEKVFEKKYIDTYMIPKVVQRKISFDSEILNSNYQIVKDSKGSRIVIGQLVRLNRMIVDLSDNPNIIDILQNIDNRYQRQGNSVVYPLNNGAGHFVIVRYGYICQ